MLKCKELLKGLPGLMFQVCKEHLKNGVLLNK